MNFSLFLIVALIGAVCCREIEMPSYEVLSSDGSMEIRSYPATKWVATNYKVKYFLNNLLLSRFLFINIYFSFLGPSQRCQ